VQGMLDMGIIRRAWNIAWPLIISEAIDSILWLTDTFFVSRLGDTALAAVGLGGYVSWVFSVFNTLGNIVDAPDVLGVSRRLNELKMLLTW